MPDAEHDGGVNHAHPGAVQKEAHVHTAPQDLFGDPDDDADQQRINQNGQPHTICARQEDGVEGEQDPKSEQ
jgi:hypothetical protein